MAHHLREPAQIAKVVHHREYYLRGGDITFLVENHLYRVHSYFFDRESTFFHQKLSVPSAPGEERPGTSDRNAFTLEGVRSIDFERFIWCFYNPKYSLYDKTVDEWASILELSDGWSFSEVKSLAVRELEKLEIEPIQKVYLYHRFNISRTYLIASYSSICVRPETLNLHEGELLGLQTTLKVAEARERIRSIAAGRTGTRSPTYADFAPADVDVVVREVFEINGRTTTIESITPSKPTTNGSHSRQPSLTKPAPQNPVPSIQTSQQYQSQDQYSYGTSAPDSPVYSKPSNSGFGQFFGAAPAPPPNNVIGLQPSNGTPEPRPEVQSPKNGATIGLPSSGSGEPHSTSAINFLSPTVEQRAEIRSMGGVRSPVDTKSKREEAAWVEAARAEAAKVDAARADAARADAARAEATRVETARAREAEQHERETSAAEAAAAEEAAREEAHGEWPEDDELQTPLDTPAETPIKTKEAQAPNNPFLSFNKTDDDAEEKEKEEEEAQKQDEDATNESSKKQGGGAGGDKKEKTKAKKANKRRGAEEVAVADAVGGRGAGGDSKMEANRGKLDEVKVVEAVVDVNLQEANPDESGKGGKSKKRAPRKGKGKKQGADAEDKEGGEDGQGEAVNSGARSVPKVAEEVSKQEDAVPSAEVVEDLADASKEEDVNTRATAQIENTGEVAATNVADVDVDLVNLGVEDAIAADSREVAQVAQSSDKELPSLKDDIEAQSPVIDTLQHAADSQLFDDHAGQSAEQHSSFDDAFTQETAPNDIVSLSQPAEELNAFDYQFTLETPTEASEKSNTTLLEPIEQQSINIAVAEDTVTPMSGNESKQEIQPAADDATYKATVREEHRHHGDAQFDGDFSRDGMISESGNTVYDLAPEPADEEIGQLAADSETVVESANGEVTPPTSEVVLPKDGGDDTGMPVKPAAEELYEDSDPWSPVS